MPRNPSSSSSASKKKKSTGSDGDAGSTSTATSKATPTRDTAAAAAATPKISKQRSTSTAAAAAASNKEAATASSGASASANAHAHPPDKKWALHDKVLCRYLHAENIYYEAKIMFLKELASGETGYGIHYPGWSSRHDEVVPQRDALIRFKDYSDEEAIKAKEEVKRAQQALSAKKRKQHELLKDESRSNTPDSSAKRKQMRRPTSSSTDTGAGPLVNKKDMPQVTLPDTLRRILIDDENLVNKQYMLPKLPARITVYDIVQKYRESVTDGGEGGGGGSLSPREFYIEYADSVNALLNPTSENLERSALGLLDYFETAVGTILLYKFERPAFNDLVEALEKRKAEEAENESEAEHKGAGSELETSKPSSSSSRAVALVAEKRICFSKQFGLPHLLRMFVRFSDMLSYTDWSERSLEAIIRHAQDFVMFLSKNHNDFYDANEDYMLAEPEYHKRVWGNQS